MENKTVYCGYWYNDAAGQQEQKVFEVKDEKTAEKLSAHYKSGLVVREEKKAK